jgi:RNA polymerase sigma factor (sigma-70 family)
VDFDKNFIEKLIKQDQQAFNEFYLKTVDVFFRYLNSYYFLDQETAEDIISDFYVKWRDVVKNFDKTQSFSGFIWTVFKNLVKDTLKKHSDTAFSNFDSEDD